MSPVRTATRSPGANDSRVRSSRLVFPAPGELTRFKQRIPYWSKRARSSAAIRSFSFRTLPSRGTRFMSAPGHELRTLQRGDVPAGDIPAEKVSIEDVPAGDVPAGDVPAERLYGMSSSSR